jgi:hypothetical protein
MIRVPSAFDDACNPPHSLEPTQVSFGERRAGGRAMIGLLFDGVFRWIENRTVRKWGARH